MTVIIFMGRAFVLIESSLLRSVSVKHWAAFSAFINESICLLRIISIYYKMSKMKRMVKSKGKPGSRYKVPRLSNDRKYVL